jgi:hypothetical protein
VAKEGGRVEANFNVRSPSPKKMKKKNVIKEVDFTSSYVFLYVLLHFPLRPLTFSRFIFLFSGHEPIYFIENKEKTLRASYDRGTQIFDYMD